MNTFRRITLGLVLAITAFGCSGRKSEQEHASTLTVKGSDTMVQLTQRWAEDFMKKHPGQQVQVTGGGSGTGISALINGTTDLCASSRPMKAEEVEKLKAKYQASGVEVRVAKDGITVFLHESNPVRELTLAQVKDIFTGKTKNWKEVGGKDERIVLYGRENSSGTYEFFKDHVLAKADFANEVQALPGTAAVVNAVTRDMNAIGYGGAGYAKGVKEASIKSDAASVAIAPTAENINAGRYPISRFLYFYLRNRPEGIAKDFIDYALSLEGQKTVVDIGYFPVR